MKRDYARKKNKSKYARPRSHWRLWCGTIMVFVLFTLGLVYLGKHYQLGSTTKTLSKPSVQAASSKQAAPVKQPKQLKPPKQPHFDFYTISK